MTEILTGKRRKIVEAVLGNEDLLREILLHLPAECLFRFKCVSKDWRSLISSSISDPKFCSDHTRMNQESSVVGIYFYFNRRESLELTSWFSLRQADRRLPTLTFLDNLVAHNSELVIVYASKGLFLCSRGDIEPFAICNVTTQKFNELPKHKHPSSYYQHDEHSAYLDFDPSESLHYKVVLVGWFDGKGDILYYNDDDREEDYNKHNGPCYEIDIYSTKSKKWKRKHFRVEGGFDFKCRALWNRAIHWVTRGFHVRFELDTETLVENLILQEPEILGEEMIRYFGECCGRLFLIRIERRSCEGLYILEMDKDFGWTVAYNVNMIPLRTAFPESFQYPDPIWISGAILKSWKFSVLCIVKENEMSDFSLLLAMPGKIISYNLKRETFTVVIEFSPRLFCLDNFYNHSTAYPFIPTLSPT